MAKKTIEIPCSKGDTVYLVDKAHNRVVRSKVEHVEYIENTNSETPFTMIKGEGFSIYFEDFNKLAFFDENDAKAKLETLS